MPTIPSGFVPTVAAYSNDAPGGVIRTDVAGGPGRYAMQFDRGTQRFNVTFILTPAQYSVWVAFFHHIIKKGAITFDMPLDSGFGSETHACNIIPGTYNAARTGGIATVVSFAVEAESKAYEMTATEAQQLIDLHNAGGGAAPDVLLARLAKFATVDTNVLAVA